MKQENTLDPEGTTNLKPKGGVHFGNNLDNVRGGDHEHDAVDGRDDLGAGDDVDACYDHHDHPDDSADSDDANGHDHDDHDHVDDHAGVDDHVDVDDRVDHKIMSVMIMLMILLMMVMMIILTMTMM